MNKEQFFSVCERARRGFLTALQWGLSLPIFSLEYINQFAPKL